MISSVPELVMFEYHVTCSLYVWGWIYGNLFGTEKLEILCKDASVTVTLGSVVIGLDLFTDVKSRL